MGRATDIYGVSKTAARGGTELKKKTRKILTLLRKKKKN